jgi:hypothetical protein
MPIDRSQYVRGQYMVGAAHAADGYLIADVPRQPPAPERKGAIDPRLADVRARTAALAATAAKVDLLKQRIEALAAQVKRK